MKRTTLWVPASASASALAWAALALLSGCGGDAERAVTLRFASAELRANAAAVEVYVTPACGTLGTTGADAPDALRSEVIVPGTPAQPLGTFPAGTVGIYARARGSDCVVYAAGCTETDLGAGGAAPVVVDLAALAGPGCAAGDACAVGQCVAGGGAGDAGDAGDAGEALDALDVAPGCEAGAACAGGCRDLSADPLNCGACGRACAVPAHGAATCAAGTCGLACDPGFHACGAACADDADPAACGAACTVCPGTPNGHAVCQGGACEIACDPGTLPAGGLCQPPPRPLAPGSTAVVASPRPLFRWITAAGVAASAVKLCRDRACSEVLQTMTPSGASVAPDADLAPGTVFWRVEGTAGSVTVPGPTWELSILPGAAPPDHSAVTAPDLDGDGFADVLAGAPGADSVLALRGAPGGPDGVWSALPSPGSGTQFGASVAGAGDVDGDGFGDALVGAPGSNAAYLFRGSAAGVVDAGTRIPAPTGVSLFGVAVSAAGDVDADGYADVVVGAGGSNRGKAFVFRGGAQGLNATPVTLQDSNGPRTQFGASVTGGADTDGDGYADVAVGAPANNRVYVFGGSALGTATSGTVIVPPTGATGFGAAVAMAGDANGDGLADLVVGAPGAAQAFVYLGGPGGPGAPGGAAAIPLAPPGGSTGFGTAVAMIGDVDGDGYGEVAVGAPGAGVVYVYPGSASGPTGSPAVLTAPAGATGFGASLAPAGDVDGNGFADVLVGASGASEVFLYLGSATGLVPAPLPAAGLAPAAAFGASVARATPRTLPRARGLARSFSLAARRQRRG